MKVEVKQCASDDDRSEKNELRITIGAIGEEEINIVELMSIVNPILNNPEMRIDDTISCIAKVISSWIGKPGIRFYIEVRQSPEPIFIFSGSELQDLLKESEIH